MKTARTALPASLIATPGLATIRTLLLARPVAEQFARAHRIGCAVSAGGDRGTVPVHHNGLGQRVKSAALQKSGRAQIGDHVENALDRQADK